MMQVAPQKWYVSPRLKKYISQLGIHSLERKVIQVGNAEKMVGEVPEKKHILSGGMNC